MNLAHIWLEPRRDLGMVVLTNRGDEQAHAALLRVAQQLYGRFAAPVTLPHWAAHRSAGVVMEDQGCKRSKPLTTIGAVISSSKVLPRPMW
jgi:hypothetical protein